MLVIKLFCAFIVVVSRDLALCRAFTIKRVKCAIASEYQLNFQPFKSNMVTEVDNKETKMKLFDSSSSAKHGKAVEAEEPLLIIRRYLTNEKYWKDELPTLEEAFGSYTELPRRGRDEVIKAAWSWLLTDVPPSIKRRALYVHASPGIGKTFVLREIYKKLPSDIPMGCEVEVANTVILVAEFNRKAVEKASVYKQHFIERPGLFVLSRLYYVTFAKQDAYSWTSFCRYVVKCIRDDLEDDLGHALLSRLKEKRGDKRTIVLVDEILKTEAFGSGFAELCRSEICGWLDDDIVGNVLFSTLDLSFIENETSWSGRPMISVGTLPLLDMDDTVSILEASLNHAKFVDENEFEIDRSKSIRQLAQVAGGHPRSIEQLIVESKVNLGLRMQIASVIERARKVITPYFRVSDVAALWKAVILAEEVDVDSHLVAGDETSETFLSLVSRGMLLASFNEATYNFIPSAPELFLHGWVQKQGGKLLPSDMLQLLKDILDMRRQFTATGFERFHSLWERLIRYLRTPELHGNLPLHQLYRIKLGQDNNYRTDDKDFARRSVLACPVNGSSRLIVQKYSDGSRLQLDPSVIYIPENKQNAEWDRLIVLEAFPKSGASDKEYLLPVFIQNKFSDEGVTTKLSSDEVKAAHEKCKEFMLGKVDVKEGWSLVSEDSLHSRADYEEPPINVNFALIFVAKRDIRPSAISEAPFNVLFCCESELKTMYGPVLFGFLSQMVIGQTVSVATVDDRM